MTEDIAHSICFTGHRPEKLPTGIHYQRMLKTLHLCIDEAVRKGFTTFYTGLADGIDHLVTVYLHKLRMTNPQIRIIGVQPCTDYYDFFWRRGYDTSHLDMMLAIADRIIVLPEKSRDPKCFLRRNCYMVDRSSAIIAVCRNTGYSGSMQAFRYAVKRNLSLCRVCLESAAYSASSEEDTLPVYRKGF